MKNGYIIDHAAVPPGTAGGGVAMFALERRTGHCWIRCAVCGNRALLDRVRAGQPRLYDWRVAAVARCNQYSSENFARIA